MSQEAKRNPIDELADSFMQRFRQGERPSLSEYTERYPELADEIREVFPALVMMYQIEEDLQELYAEPEVEPICCDLESQILGDYRLIREVGRGGMGVVYEAEQISLARQVALKILPRQVLRDAKYQQRFLREAKSAAKLHHTNIVPVFGVGEQDGLKYLVMQFIHGQGLDEVLIELKRLRDESLSGRALSKASEMRPGLRQAAASPEAKSVTNAQTPEKKINAQSVAQSLVSGRFERTVLVSGEPENLALSPEFQAAKDTETVRLSDTHIVSQPYVLPGQSETGSRVQSRSVYWQSVARIGQQAADALQYAHEQGVIHRDVKPGNLLLDTSGNVWMADFGLAKTADQQDLTQTGDILGTIRYMAPEQFDGQADIRSDVYSLGLTLYELLALQPGFDETDRHKLIKQVTTGTPPRLHTLDSHIPRDLQTVVHKAIDRDPTHRYQSAGELSADLELYLRDEPIKARWISPITRLARWCKRNPAVAALTTAVAILLIAATVGASVAAYKFRELAESLNSALGDANSNLELATTEQKRAEVNLDLALAALDTVYLDAIGEEKLLGEPISHYESNQNRGWVIRPKLSDLENNLLKKGLSFYDELARQNPTTQQAVVQSALAYHRVGLIQAALGDRDSAIAAYEAAIQSFRKLTQQAPDNPEYFCLLAEAYRGLGSSLDNWKKAEVALEKAHTAYTVAIRLQPNNAETIYRRGVIFKQKGDMEGHTRDVLKAVSMEPNELKYLCAAASASEPDKSLEFALRALGVAPRDPLVHATLGEVYGTGIFHLLKKGDDVHIVKDRAKAMFHFDQAVNLSSESPEFLGRRAHFYSEIGDYVKAMRDIDRILKLDPNSIEALNFRSQLKNATGDLQQALKDLLVVLANDPHDYECLDRLAAVYRQMEEWEQELEALNHATAVRPKYWINYKHRAVAHVHLERYDLALLDFEKAVRLNISDSSTLAWMGKEILETPVSFQKNLLELAEKLTQEFQNTSSIFLARGRLYLDLGKQQEASADFSRAAELSPDNSAPWLYLARIEFQKKDYRRSQEMSELGLKRNANDYSCQRIRGISSYYLEEYLSAYTAFSRALELYPHDIDTIVWRAATLFQMLRCREALTDCYHAIRIDSDEALLLLMKKLW